MQPAKCDFALHNDINHTSLMTLNPFECYALQKKQQSNGGHTSKNALCSVQDLFLKSCLIYAIRNIYARSADENYFAVSYLNASGEACYLSAA